MNTNENPYRSEDDQILARLRSVPRVPDVDYEESVCSICGEGGEVHDHPEEADEFCHWLDGRVDRADR